MTPMNSLRLIPHANSVVTELVVRMCSYGFLTRGVSGMGGRF